MNKIEDTSQGYEERQWQRLNGNDTVATLCSRFVKVHNQIKNCILINKEDEKPIHGLTRIVKLRSSIKKD